LHTSEEDVQCDLVGDVGNTDSSDAQYDLLGGYIEAGVVLAFVLLGEAKVLPDVGWVGVAVMVVGDLTPILLVFCTGVQ